MMSHFCGRAFRKAPLMSLKLGFSGRKLLVKRIDPQILFQAANLDISISYRLDTGVEFL